MDGFVNNTAKLCWLNIKQAKKEDTIGLLMLYSAIQHPELMHNMLPYFKEQSDELGKEM